ncbi:MAG: hypothetical protein HY815_19585 [Candidatus Riflebacteria bacterium]|nr:hypothetical protein [Candidatus Riflebacteria bacterium]
MTRVAAPSGPAPTSSVVTEVPFVWVDGRSPWTRTGLDLAIGERFRVEVRGFLAQRYDPDSPGWGTEYDRSVALRPDDVTAPQGTLISRMYDTRIRALVARVGRHELPVPIPPDSVQVAQDAGPLLVRIAGCLHKYDDIGLLHPGDLVSRELLNGLILVRARRVP